MKDDTDYAVSGKQEVVLHVIRFWLIPFEREQRSERGKKKRLTLRNETQLDSFMSLVAQYRLVIYHSAAAFRSLSTPVPR